MSFTWQLCINSAHAHASLSILFKHNSVFISAFVFVLFFFFTLKCKWNPHRSRRNLTEFTSLLDSYTNLFIFIDQFCHSTKKNRSHHVHNFLRTPQTDVVDKLNSIHPQLAVELLAKETVKYNLSWWPRKWWISWMNWLKHRISEKFTKELKQIFDVQLIIRRSSCII